MPSRLEAIIALLDEVIVIVVVAVLALYILHSYNVITGLEAAVILSMLVAGIAAVAWKVAEAQVSGEKVGPESLIGKTAVVVDPLTPEGMVLVEGELWKAITRDGSGVEAGRRVRITGYTGLTLIVEPVGDHERMRVREGGKPG